MPNYAVPHIGALAAPDPTVEAVGQLATSIGTLPQDMQTAKLAQANTALDLQKTKAESALLPGQQALDAATLADQQAELGTKGMQRLVQAGLSNPAVVRNPAYGAALEQYAKLAGVPVTRLPNGEYDLRSMIPKTPIPDADVTRLQSLTPQQRQAELASHPEWSYTPEFANMDPVVTQADRNDAWRGFDLIITKLADPKGGGIDALKAFADSPAGKAIFPNLQALANDPQVQAALAARAQAFATDQRYKDVIHPEEMADIARRRLDLDNNRLTMSEADKARAENDKLTHWAQQNAQWTRSFGQRQQNFDLAQRRFDAAVKSQNAAAIGKYATELQREVSTMQTGLDSLNTNIRSYVVGGQDAPQALIDQRDALQQRLSAAQAAADVALTQSGAQLTSTVQTAAGATRAQLTAPQGPRTPGTFSNGQRGYSQGGQYFLEDGTRVDENGNRI